ncbi:MAG: chorismate mutase [Actinomycetales bacterium]|nr:MAG: chorismate mutase [Actinomycetales bacterium]
MTDLPPELLRLRASIDNLDAALVHLLAERFRCTQQVGELKASRGLPPSDRVREEAQMARLRRLAEQSGLDPVFAEKVLAFIIAEVIRNHGVIAGHHEDSGPSQDAGHRPSTRPNAT